MIPETPQKPIIVVLGMHRSGTSVVTRIFSLLGADVGKNLMPPAEDNPAGFWEPGEIVAVHDELLQHLGYSWSDPRALPYKWWKRPDIKVFEDRLLKLVKQHYADIDLPIIKDPRLCRLLPLWNRIFKKLGWKAHFVLVGRSPIEVADSLAKRNALSVNHSHLLWLRHVVESELWSRENPRTFLLYNQLFENWQSEIKRCKRELGLKQLRFSKSRESEINDYIDQSLQHSKASQESFDSASDLLLFVSDAFSQIKQAATCGLVESELQKQFDSISQQVVNADSLYSSIWLPYLKQRDAATASMAELEDQRKANMADVEHYRGLANVLQTQNDEFLGKVQSLSVRVGEGEALSRELDRRHEEYMSSKVEYERIIDEKNAEITAAVATVKQLSQLEKVNQDQLNKIVSLQSECQKVGELLTRKDTELITSMEIVAGLDEQIVELDKEIVQRGEWGSDLDRQLKETQDHIVELDKEIVRRGEWGLDLDRQLKDSHDQIRQITSSPSWMLTLPLRELRRWLDHPLLQTKRYLRYLLKHIKNAYERLPLSSSTKMRHKHFLIKYSPWVLQATDCFTLSSKDQLIPDQMDYTVVDCQQEANNICLNTASEPVVSVIIPVYGKCEYTIRCLASIAQNPSSELFEVIVVDDSSPDNTVEILSMVKGIRLIKNRENLGFIRTCNHGAEEARGQFLLFLNNDTVVLPGWLDELKRTFDDNDNVGLVGSKLIYPDGTLQEAGGIIWQDGSGWNYGRNDDPDKPAYNYLREVDYCSGASIMVPRKLFFDVGCFDERYIPAYYEDTDLAFSLREKGYRVMYQPLSRIVHYEGVSSGTDLNSGVKKYQVDNSKKFYEKWKRILADHRKNGDSPDYEKERNVEKRILVIDAVTPAPDKDSGSVDVQSYFTILLSLGYKITFIPADNFQNVEGYTELLQRQGIECLYFPFNRDVLTHLKEKGDEYEVVMLYRADYASLYIDDVKKYCPDAMTIFNTVDLHYLRMQRQAEIEDSEPLRREAARYKEMELSLIEKADKTIILSEAESSLLLNEGVAEEKLSIVPLIREIPGRNNAFNNRKDIVFVGGFQHTPNIDAILYFCNEIWPLIRNRLKTIKLYIIGSNMPDSIKQLDIPGVYPVGFIKDLSDYFDNSRLSVAPLRYGAGLKGKVGASLAYGLPCVATSTAVEGSGLIDNEQVLVADDPEAFSKAVCELYDNQELWESLSVTGLEFVSNEYSIEAGRSRIMKVLD